MNIYDLDANSFFQLTVPDLPCRVMVMCGCDPPGQQSEVIRMDDHVLAPDVPGNSSES